MEQKIITAHNATELNARITKMIAEGWEPVGSHQVVTKLEQRVYSGMEHKRTEFDLEYSQTMKKA